MLRKFINYTILSFFFAVVLIEKIDYVLYITAPLATIILALYVYFFYWLVKRPKGMLSVFLKYLLNKNTIWILTLIYMMASHISEDYRSGTYLIILIYTVYTAVKFNKNVVLKQRVDQKVTDTVPQQHTATKVVESSEVQPDMPVSYCDEICSKLNYISGEIEDIDLQNEINTIIKVIRFIYEHSDDDENKKYIDIVDNFSAHLYKQLVRYDKIENMRLDNDSAKLLMSHIHEFTKDTGRSFNNILTTISNHELFKHNSEVEALRAELRIRGLVD